MIACKICGNSENNKSYFVKEMMFGFRDIFEYIECGVCGCLQIKEVPANLEKYYPNNYYSFGKPKNLSWLASMIEPFVRKERAKYALTGRGLLGKYFARLKSSRAIYKWLKKCHIDFNSKILDVGSGSGTLVVSLYRDGFKNIEGADPYIPEEVKANGKVLVKKCDLSEPEGGYDLIMMHHSLEHMPNQQKVFEEIYRLLKPGGMAFIRIPTVSSVNWKRFGVHWANLDAPRHLYLHSIDSIKLLATDVGLRAEDIVFDSNDFGFWASMQYAQDIPLRDQRSYVENPDGSLFTREKIKEFKREAKKLNIERQGDQICVFLRKL